MCFIYNLSGSSLYWFRCRLIAPIAGTPFCACFFENRVSHGSVIYPLILAVYIQLHVSQSATRICRVTCMLRAHSYQHLTSFSDLHHHTAQYTVKVWMSINKLKMTTTTSANKLKCVPSSTIFTFFDVNISLSQNPFRLDY